MEHNNIIELDDGPKVNKYKGRYNGRYKEYEKQKYQQNKADILQYQHNYYQNNKEKVKERQKQKYEERKAQLAKLKEIENLFILTGQKNI